MPSTCLAAQGWQGRIPIAEGLKRSVAQFRASLQQQLMQL
jgi:hypothetical protein